MHHPSSHWNDDLPHVVPQASVGQGMNSPRRQSQIDGAPAAYPHSPHISAAFVDFDLEAALRETQREQRTVQASAYQRDGLGFASHEEYSWSPAQALELLRQKRPRLPQFRKEFLVESKFQVRRSGTAARPHAISDDALHELDVPKPPTHDQFIKFRETFAYIDPVPVAVF